MDSAALGLIILALAVPANPAHAVSCPIRASKLEHAAPILGQIDGTYPWGELHSEASVKKDGLFVQTYDLRSRTPARTEKWMICYYRDGRREAVKLATEVQSCKIVFEKSGVDLATKQSSYKIDIVCQ